MPRTGRIKTLNSIFHVMIRSISDVNLFLDELDKKKYLKLIKRYQDIFGFKVYAYCLMSNHAHIIIDAYGADISKFMHGINQSYAQYFNRKYDRHGHLFQDRFKSKIIADDAYLIVLSGYIHRNPIDINKYKKCIEKYKFSSLGVYLGIFKDEYGILDEDFIMQFFGKDILNSRKRYLEFVKKCNDLNVKLSVNFEDEKKEYRSHRIIINRKYKSDDIFNFIQGEMFIKKEIFHEKYSRKSLQARAISVLLMRRFCNFTEKQICEALGGLTQSRISKLCSIAHKLIFENRKYENIINNFVKKAV